MGVLEHSVWIKAAPTQVWRTYVDPTRIPQWQTGNPTVRDVQGEPGEPGSTYVSRRGPLGARTTVLTADVPRELVTRTDTSFGLAVRGHLLAEPAFRRDRPAATSGDPLAPRLRPFRHARGACRPQPSRGAQGARQPEGARRAGSLRMTAAPVVDSGTSQSLSTALVIVRKG